MSNEITWQIGGPAGYGIKSVGVLLAKVATRSGLSAFGYYEYPSLIRGGHNVYQVVVSESEARAAKNEIDFLVCLDESTFALHEDQLGSGAAIIFDGSKMELVSKRGDLNFYPVPTSEIALASGGSQIHANMGALGASLALMGLNLKILNDLIDESFSGKGVEVVKINQKVAKAGFDFIEEKYEVKIGCKLSAKSSKPRMFITGNEATAMGVIAGGCRFFSAYPMTPATAILDYLMEKEREIGMIVKQTEDEISAINMAIGAAWTGARSFTSTSGGGFCLMTEALGLAAMAEVPLVVANVQRPGPSTGMPTWTEQSDLNLVLNAGQGEFERIVLAPGDPAECFELTRRAFDLAEKYQMPVLLLSDKLLGESSFTTEKFDSKSRLERGKILSQSELSAFEAYQRYQITSDGVSPRALPGMDNGVHLANSDEHDELGFSSDDADNRIAQMIKRAKKIDGVSKEVEAVKVYGSGKADISIIGWGSTKGVIMDAVDQLARKGIKSKFVQIKMLSPFPSEQLTKALIGCKKIFVVENNQTGQLADLIKKNNLLKVHKILKYDGRPFFAEEIIRKIK